MVFASVVNTLHISYFGVACFLRKNVTAYNFFEFLFFEVRIMCVVIWQLSDLRRRELADKIVCDTR